MANEFPSSITVAADTSTAWSISTRVLKVGEMALETNTGKMYIGDGTNLISSGNLRFVTFATS